MSSTDEDLFGEGDGNGVTGFGLGFCWGAPDLDGGDGACFVVGRKDELVTDAEGAGFDATGEDAPVIESVDVLNGEAQRHIVERHGGFEGVEHFEHGRSFVPWGGIGSVGGSAFRDVDAFARGDGDEGTGFNADLFEERRIFFAHGGEDFF